VAGGLAVGRDDGFHFQKIMMLRNIITIYWKADAVNGKGDDVRFGNGRARVQVPSLPTLYHASTQHLARCRSPRRRLPLRSRPDPSRHRRRERPRIPDTEKRIRRAAKQLNYTPNRLAQQLRGASSKTLGLIVETENIPVMSERLFAMEREASRRVIV